ncbi:MAG: T9SS type A sorting domain-containing protein, partial [Chitinophagales bacterium]
SSIVVSPAQSTIYTVTVSDDEGNSTVETLTVNVTDLVVNYQQNCSEGLTSIDQYEVVLNLAGNQAPYEIFVENPNGMTLFSDEDAAAGNYTFSVPNNDDGFMILVFDNMGCSQTIDAFGAAPCGTLPVELFNFDGEVRVDNNLLTWYVTSEINNDFFGLHYSPDGIRFKLIATIDGRGTANDMAKYEFTHKQPKAGVGYYYLTQTDYDGTNRTLSEVITLNRDGGKLEFTALKPVPTSTNLIVDFNANEALSVDAELYDSMGRLVAKRSYGTSIGENSFTMDVSNFSNGYYFIKLHNGEERIIERFLKN